MIEAIPRTTPMQFLFMFTPSLVGPVNMPLLMAYGWTFFFAGHLPQAYNSLNFVYQTPYVFQQPSLVVQGFTVCSHRQEAQPRNHCNLAPMLHKCWLNPCHITFCFISLFVPPFARMRPYVHHTSMFECLYTIRLQYHIFKYNVYIPYIQI